MPRFYTLALKQWYHKEFANIFFLPTFLGISKILPNLLISVDTCIFKLENFLDYSKVPIDEWFEIDEKINEMKVQLESLLNIVGSVPQDIDMDLDSGS